MDRRILVVDDNELDCQQLLAWMDRPDRRIKVVHDGTIALECLIEGNFSLALVDLQLPGIGGLELIREARNRDLPVTLIVLTGHASIDTAVEAMKLGAYDYITKPVDPPLLDVLIERALEDRKLLDQVVALRQDVRARFAASKLLGQGPQMKEVFGKVAKVATSGCTVLITGETGTGKELVAQALHDSDPSRRGGPWVAVNCAALPESLLERELFGNEQGAYTDALQRRPGLFERAGGGTLLLDEIGEMPLAMQAKILRVLQDGSFQRLGGTETIRTDARILAATNVNLAEAVAAGRFREDLYFRLNVVTVELPPLRDRVEDLPLLVEHFARQLHKDRGLPLKSFSRATLARMAGYEWPGNVRELQHLVEMVIITTPGPVVEPEDLPQNVVSTREAPFSLDFDPARPLQEITDEFTERVERAYLERVLEKYRGKITPTAEHCGLSRRSISEKLRRYRIDKTDFKPHLARRRSISIGD